MLKRLGLKEITINQNFKLLKYIQYTIYNMQTVYKPWGKEIWLELNEFYC